MIQCYAFFLVCACAGRPLTLIEGNAIASMIVKAPYISCEWSTSGQSSLSYSAPIEVLTQAWTRDWQNRTTDWVLSGPISQRIKAIKEYGSSLGKRPDIVLKLLHDSSPLVQRCALIYVDFDQVPEQNRIEIISKGFFGLSDNEDFDVRSQLVRTVARTSWKPADRLNVLKYLAIGDKDVEIRELAINEAIKLARSLGSKETQAAK